MLLTNDPTKGLERYENFCLCVKLQTNILKIYPVSVKIMGCYLCIVPLDDAHNLIA